jgi:glycosyltransferase involved in cell wall biosynthesis
MSKPRLIIATTVSETLATILNGQPKFLNQYFEVALVASPDKSFLSLSEEGVEVYPVPMARSINILGDLRSLFLLVWLLARIKPDIIHSYTPKAGLLCMLAAWICRVPNRVHTFTGLIWPTSSGFLRFLLTTLDRVLCFCSTNIIAESRGVLNDLTNQMITRKPISILGFGNIAGVDVLHFSKRAPGLDASSNGLRLQCEINDNEFVFIYIGRLNRDKGLRELLCAYLSLCHQCHLIIVGALDRESPLDQQTLRLIKSHNKIHWLGFQGDIRPALNVSNVIILPSYREGFPNVLLQAGAMELPAIATDVSGSNEIITNDYNGWLVPVRDVNALVGAMHKAMSCSPCVLRNMGLASRNRVQKLYERNAHWSRLLKFYQSLDFSSSETYC